MNLSQRFNSGSPPVSLIWRFYSDPAHQWRWQRLAVDGMVIEHSTSGYSQYESCLANAIEHGYVFLPPSTSKMEKKPSVKRSYMRLSTNRQELVSETVPEDAEKVEGLPTEDAPEGALMTREEL
jgi:hypothetical protein